MKGLHRGSREWGIRIWGAFSLLWVSLVLGVMGYFVVSAALFAGHVNLVGAFFGITWDPLNEAFGIFPFIVASFLVTVLALGLSFPFALALGTLVGQYFAGRARRVMRFILTVFMAVPSVIYGWWGLTLIVPWLRAQGLGIGFGMLAAGMVLAVMVLPTMALLFSETFSAIPSPVIEGALALGATDDKVLKTLIWPISQTGIRNGVLVALARALGETMAVQMVIGGQVQLIHSLTQPASTITTQLLADLTVLPVGTPGHGALDFMALVLIGAMYGIQWISEERV